MTDFNALADSIAYTGDGKFAMKIWTALREASDLQAQLTAAQGELEAYKRSHVETENAEIADLKAQLDAAMRAHAEGDARETAMLEHMSGYKAEIAALQARLAEREKDAGKLAKLLGQIRDYGYWSTSFLRTIDAALQAHKEG